MRAEISSIILFAFLFVLASCGTSYNDDTVNEGKKSASITSTTSSTSEDAQQKTINIECANGNVAFATEKTAEGMLFSYLLNQDIITSKLRIDYDGTDIIVSTSDGKLIQKIEIDLMPDSTGNYIKFIDFNRDNYVDIQFSSGGGILNENYLIYLWDNDSEKYVPLICDFDEPLSYYEVYDGYVLNWVKSGASSVLVQTLIWTDENTLSLKSESYMELKS